MPKTKAVAQKYTGRELRYLSDMYEQSQRLRIATGENIRAILQGRDETWIVDEIDPGADADIVLTDIRSGETVGPVPILGRTYKRHWDVERECYKEMMGALEAHPVWDFWLKKVKGVGPTLGCKLLARLNIDKAPYPSSFISYCGIATVPGKEYRCSECGYVRTFPLSFKVSGDHKRLRSQSKCKGKLELLRTHTPAVPIRAAQPKPSKGEKISYDPYAKKTMYNVITSFLRSRNSPYAEFYRKQKEWLQREKPGWPAGAIHFTAIRKTQKVFLNNLWMAWREALGLPVPPTYPEGHLGHSPDSIISPWDMVES